MNLLALETSTDACSVALMTIDGCIHSEFALTPREHTAYLPRMMDQVLNAAGVSKSELGAIAYASGPGAFTGVRIAAATAQGLALGLGVKLVPVSTLAVLAQQACDALDIDRVSVALDARMGEVYAGAYQRSVDHGLVEASADEALVALADWCPATKIMAVGSGVRACREAGYLQGRDLNLLRDDLYPTAAALARLAHRQSTLGLGVAATKGGINYLRNQVAWQKQPV